MRRRIRQLLGLLGLLFLLTSLSVYGALFAQANARSLACREVSLTRKPGWTFSGVWTSDNPPQLLIVDGLYQTVLRYSAEGESLGPIGEPLKSALYNLLPRMGSARGSDVILEVSDGFVVLDQNLRPSRSTSVPRAKAAGPWSLGAIWEWQPAGRDIVAFVDVYPTGSDPTDIKQYKSAFVRFPLENPGELTVLGDTVDLHDNDKTFFRAGNPYIAVLGDTAYFLSSRNGLSLIKNEKGSSKLEDLSYLLPESIKGPSLPPYNARKDYYVELLETLEKHSAPVGLYGWNNSLYVLTRTPTSQGNRWELTSIDPTRQKTTSGVELDIRASEVTVVPGPQVWAFIEKGPAKGFHIQDISRLLTIPSQLLKAPLRSNGMMCSR
jgi:hypothetical protein